MSSAGELLDALTPRGQVELIGQPALEPAGTFRLDRSLCRNGGISMPSCAPPQENKIGRLQGLPQIIFSRTPERFP